MKAFTSYDFDNLNDRVEAAAMRLGRMSCAQSLISAYADLVDLEEDQAMRLVEGFGGGMFKGQTCGAVTVMLMLAGLAGKGSRCEGLMNAFEKEMGSTMCSRLVKDTGPDRCPELLRCAARLLNERIFSE